MAKKRTPKTTVVTIEDLRYHLEDMLGAVLAAATLAHKVNLYANVGDHGLLSAQPAQEMGKAALHLRSATTSLKRAQAIWGTLSRRARKAAKP